MRLAFRTQWTNLSCKVRKMTFSRPDAKSGKTRTRRTRIGRTGTTETHNKAHTQHLQDMGFHVRNVFYAHIAGHIWHPTYPFTLHVLFFELCQTTTVHGLFQVDRPLRRCGVFVQNSMPFNKAGTTCRGLLDRYRFSKCFQVATALWLFLVVHFNMLCMHRAQPLVCKRIA